MHALHVPTMAGADYFMESYLGAPDIDTAWLLRKGRKQCLPKCQMAPRWHCTPNMEDTMTRCRRNAVHSNHRLDIRHVGNAARPML